MNTYNINDEEFKNSDLLKDFLRENPTTGNLKIRAYAASEAIPISGVKIVISTIFDNNKIIFFEGVTDSSGVIERIVLPTPRLETSNLNIPNTISYDINATYNDNTNFIYKINMYENICVVQNINIVPNTIRVGGFKWQ